MHLSWHAARTALSATTNKPFSFHVVRSELVDEGRTGVLFSDARQLADQL
jgi:hypothetical protein